MRKIFLFSFLLLALILGIGSLTQLISRVFFYQEIKAYGQHEKFDPGLMRLNSMDKLENFVDSLAATQGLTVDSIPEYVNLVDSVVRYRFYHGFQTYRFSDNWIAYLLGKYVWQDFFAKVIPDHILDGPNAMCSQSTIVFMELIRKKGFNVRAVLLPGHFCAEVLVNGNWKFIDVSLKPSFRGLPQLSAEDLAENPNYLKEAYLYSFSEDFYQNYELIFKQELISYGKVNAFPAPQMLVFHYFTFFLVYFGWGFFFALGLTIKKLSPAKLRTSNKTL